VLYILVTLVSPAWFPTGARLLGAPSLATAFQLWAPTGPQGSSRSGPSSA
jgi:hypothetical protein